jgi:Cd(II)/Pb(II)-responsive transcriptional regulator
MLNSRIAGAAAPPWLTLSMSTSCPPALETLQPVQGQAPRSAQERLRSEFLEPHCRALLRGQPVMKIGELAGATATRAETIRFYEREGLLPPAARTDGNYRVYGQAHAERLSFIRHCRGLDMSLGEIRLLLRFRDAPEEDCGDVNALLDEQIERVGRRVRELRQLERQLKALRERCRTVHDAGHCGILAELDKAARADLTPTLPSVAP